MSDYDYDIGVLGGGAAGLTVASGASQFGAKTILIEKEKALGGDCLHFGCVPSKTLIKTAHVYHQMRNAAKYGLPAHDLKPVDFRAVAARIQGVIDEIQKHDSEERFCKLGVKVEFGDAVFTDEHTADVNGKSYTANKWVIATGSSPSVPPVEGLDKTPYLTNKEIFSLDSLPKSLIVIGAGPIAIEMAQSFCRLGSKVSVIQRSGQILSKEDKDLADIAMHVMAAEGIEFYLEAAIEKTVDHGKEKEVVIKKKDGSTLSLKAEQILVALGRQVNVEGMGLEAISLDYDRKGIKVDEKMRTNHKHIYAAGDVTGMYQFTHAAGYEGGVALSNAILHLPKKANYTNLPWCTYSDPELASIGMNEKRAIEAGIEYKVWTEEFRNNDRSLAEGEENGKIKMLLDGKGNPIGMQILGPHAGELISEWVAVMNGGIKLSTIASAVHPYPSLSEINKKVVGNYYSGKIFSEKVQKTLKFFFHFKGRAC
ncbi:MAG: FAD-dependent oxidoreductase [Nitrospira sp.]|nr:FAD-dependent oxidoreductase [bacterium]MBL7049796.1 FAD-dependent oxidoreductase [Nitrospira sp.]